MRKEYCPKKNPLIWNGRKIDLRYKKPIELSEIMQLWMFVINNAIETALWSEWKKGLERNLEKRKAIEWIYSDDRSRGNSFLNLCEVCGVNPQKIRDKLSKQLFDKELGGL